MSHISKFARFAFFVGFPSMAFAGDWEPLIDSDLSKWEVWTGVPHTSVEIDWPSKADKARDGEPLGLKDPLRIYQVTKDENGELQLFITGQVYAGLTTTKEYKNYHLRAEVKWGEKKWQPRLDAPRDSGILYHCKGEHGAFWKVWKQSLEFQVQENDNGDYFKIGNVRCEVPFRYTKNKNRPIYDPYGSWGEVGGGMYSAQRSHNHEKQGGWNKVEVITMGDRSIHLSNGKVVMALRNTTYKTDKGFLPLTDGQIQIQSEGAEVTYRKLEIKQIDSFPEEYKLVHQQQGPLFGVYRVVSEPQEGAFASILEHKNDKGEVTDEKTLYLSGESILDPKDVLSAIPDLSQPGNILLKLTDEGGMKINKATKEMKMGSDRIAIILDEKLRSAPVVISELGKEFMISGLGTVESAQKLSKLLTP